MAELEVILLNRQRAVRIDRGAVVGFMHRLLHAEPAGAADAIGICLVSDERMTRANRRFRGRNAPTDVLAFPAERSPGPDGSRYLGDILVSVESARRQALELGVSLDRELRTLLIHGYLHLLGHDHEVDGGRMLRRQRQLERLLLGDRRKERSSG